MAFAPTRTAALERLRAFLPGAGRDYARRRNFDLPGHPHVSGLSPYLRHRLLTEEEVLRAVLGRFSPASSEKFIQEVVWRTYWKGWLQMRPGIWDAYRAELRGALNRVQSEAGLRAEWEAACTGTTGIACFDHWARELAATGYLHNHARMWFASIWIFTLRLPWELGADFFLRHLLDGDPASNTLSWRWVGGLHTRGKTYLARPDNIARYTEERFNPAGQLAAVAEPLPGGTPPPIRPVSDLPRPDPAKPTGLLLSEEDLSPGFVIDQAGNVQATAWFSAAADRSPLAVSPGVLDFTRRAMDDTLARHADRLGPVTGPLVQVEEAVCWAQTAGLAQIVMPFAPVGPAADRIAAWRTAFDAAGLDLVPVRRDYDSQAWPHATHGFFRFRQALPDLLAGFGPGR